MRVIVCPLCQVGMKLAAGLDSVWVCPVDASHEFCADLPEEQLPEREPEEALGPPAQLEAMPADNALLQRAQGYWLSHLGIGGPISRVPQSNIRDGSLCLPLGPVQKGGGSKSGRSRKKPTKGGKKWSEYE